ncbi:MAG: hypothetical protein ABEH43_09935 [Flavobacteriales bacterium]
MSEGHKYVQPNEALQNLIEEVNLPINSINDITKRYSSSIAIFSDYGPENERFTTYAYYVVDWNCSGLLLEEINKVKGKYGIEEREISYKKRTDGKKRKAFPEWINEVRNFPGLIYVVAIENNPNNPSNYHPDRKRLQQDAELAGIETNIDTLQKLADALIFLGIIGPFFERNQNLAWVTDPDKIIDGNENKQIFRDSFGFILDKYVKENLNCVAFTDGFRENEEEVDGDDDNAEGNRVFKEFLSIPDMACSSFSSAFNNSRDKDLILPDNEAGEITKEFAKFKNIKDFCKFDESICYLGISLFETKDIDDELYWIHKSLDLSSLDNSNR